MDTIFITKYTSTTCSVDLVPSRAVKLENLGDRCKYFLIIGCGLKTSKSAMIRITTDKGEVPLLDKFGNNVYSNQLSTRKRYVVGYGNNNQEYDKGQFILYENLCLPSPTPIKITTSDPVITYKSNTEKEK